MKILVDERFIENVEGAKEFLKNFECENCHDTGLLTSTHICEGFMVECEECA
jgi:hypothetical protein